MDLKKFRHDHRLYQSDLAELFSCRQSNISLIETGERNLTQLQLRLLIDKYGIDVVAPYLDDGDKLPVGITINAPKITGNSAPVQNVTGGDGTQTTTDSTLVQVMKQQSDQITKLLEQQERLINLLEKANGKD